jgi:hypothetical protein
MGGSGMNEKEVWYTLERLSTWASLVCGHRHRPAGTGVQCQARIRSGAIPAWG